MSSTRTTRVPTRSTRTPRVPTRPTTCLPSRRRQSPPRPSSGITLPVLPACPSASSPPVIPCA
ncbi:hypothetical protein ACP70R_049060 [Stipagrostis hirtigluma subsp. patula]